MVKRVWDDEKAGQVLCTCPAFRKKHAERVFCHPRLRSGIQERYHLVKMNKHSAYSLDSRLRGNDEEGGFRVESRMTGGACICTLRLFKKRRFCVFYRSGLDLESRILSFNPIPSLFSNLNHISRIEFSFFFLNFFSVYAYRSFA